MIKAETDKGEITIDVHGDLGEILADLTVIMADIYKNLDKNLQEIYLDCISECIPNLIKHSEVNEDMHVEKEKDDDALLQEAADLALNLLKWRNGDDFNLPD